MAAISAQEQAIALSAQLRCDPDLVDSEERQGQISQTLSLLAGHLRTSEIRNSLSSSDLPKDVSAILATTILPGSVKSIDIVSQVGRVAANLAANCDAGRDGLIDAGYIEKACQTLDHYLEMIKEAQAAVKTLIASLLNMVIEGHERSSEELSNHTSSLFQISRRIQEKPDSDEESEQVIQWIWTIIGIVLEDRPSNKYISDITLPFQSYLDASTNPLPLPVLAAAAELLDTWFNQDDVDFDIYGADPIDIMLDFVQKATLQQTGRDDVNDDDEKSLAAIKGSLLNALIGLSSSISATQTSFWSRMRYWLSEEKRDDLQSCALLSFGNRAREDASAIELLQGKDSLLPSILQVLTPGITAQVLHSVVGLLRNLSIPESNKVILGETDLSDKLVELGVWSTEKDMLGSVQGGAVGIVKNLCRGNSENAARLAQHPVAINQILDLYQRIDDAAIKFEATRVFVNCIRSVSTPGAKEKSTLGSFEDGRIMIALSDMFKQSGPYPLLANESIIALALLVSFGSDVTRISICEQLHSCTARILEVLAPKEGDEVASTEVRSNLATLLRQADDGAGKGAFLEELRSTLKLEDLEGRQLCEEGKMLLV